jgi:hypothetical protein
MIAFAGILVSLTLISAAPDRAAAEPAKLSDSRPAMLYHYYGDPVSDLPDSSELAETAAKPQPHKQAERTHAREVIRAMFQQPANPFREESEGPDENRANKSPSLKLDEEPLPEMDLSSAEKAPIESPDSMFGAMTPWLDKIGYFGWVSQGVTVNTLSPRNGSNFPVGFNDYSNAYQMNQVYLALKKDVDACGSGWDVGGRVDFLYGTDSVYTESRGLETHDDFTGKWNDQRYGLALPQCYMEVFAPWGRRGLTLKLGHFYTLLGYENVPAPDNFFYSHSYSFLYGEPMTHTGMLASTKAGTFTFQAGFTRGWNNWEGNDGNLGAIGSLCWTSESGVSSAAFAIHSGREEHQSPNPSRDRTGYSIVYHYKLNDKLQYVLQHDNALETGTAGGLSANDWFGLNQYLFYTINDNWKAAVRFEWFRDGSGTQVGASPRRSADYYETSLGLNWTPNERIVLRPEVRLDWVDAPGFRPFADNTRRCQAILDCDLIVKF